MVFSLLLGTIPLMAQEDGTKCVMVETSQGETLEYYISSHPRFTQSNDKVTLTSDEGTLEFGTVDIKKVYTSIATIKIVYTVDGEVFKTYYHHAGVKIKSEAVPEKEGYSFSGWDNEPTVMPDHDITVAGTFSINSYKLTYKVDDEVYKTFDVEYGTSITPEAEPTKEGYTFSGWSEIPETMPAEDVTITGTFTINSGISNVSANADFVNTGNEIHINGLQPNEIVTIYSVSGSQIATGRASKDGKLTISTTSLTQSAYIIKTSSQTFKFTRK